MPVKSIEPWDMAAAVLANAVLDVAQTVRESDSAYGSGGVSVGARANAAATVRDRLKWLDGRIRDAERPPCTGAPAAWLRERAFLAAAVILLDAGGRCTQEVEDDDRNTARRRDAAEE